MVFEPLTLTCVIHLQVLVSAITGVSKHGVSCIDRTAAFPITAMDVNIGLNVN